MLETRVLDSSADGRYLLQLQFERSAIRLTPEQLMADIRTSLAVKIAELLFEKIEPKIMEALRGEN